MNLMTYAILKYVYSALSFAEFVESAEKYVFGHGLPRLHGLGQVED